MLTFMLHMVGLGKSFMGPMATRWQWIHPPSYHINSIGVNMSRIIGLRFIEIDCEYMSLRHKFGDTYFYCDDKTGTIIMQDCFKCGKANDIKFYRPEDVPSYTDILECPAIIDSG